MRTIFAIVLLLTGCVSTYGNPQVAQEDVLSQIIIGKTTKAEVWELLGPPQSLIENSGVMLDTWSYRYTSSQSNPAYYLPGISLLAMAFGANFAKTQGHGLGLVFTSEGIVQSISRKVYTPSWSWYPWQPEEFPATEEPEYGEEGF